MMSEADVQECVAVLGRVVSKAVKSNEETAAQQQPRQRMEIDYQLKANYDT